MTHKYIKHLLLKSTDKISTKLELEENTVLDEVCKILYWAYLGKIFSSNQFTQIAKKLIENLIANLEVTNIINNISIINGIPSILNMFQILEADQLVDISLDDEATEIFLERLQKLIIIETKKGNVDYFYGLTSAYYCLSFFMEDNKITFNFIKENIDSFINLAYENENEICFHNNLSPNSEQVFLGLAHGQAGIISLLCRLYKSGITHHRIKLTIEKNINFITKLDRAKNGDKSRFPLRISKTIISEKTKDKLINTNIDQYMIFNGWCHGDLNISICMSTYSQCFGDHIKAELAKEITLNVVQNNLFNEAQNVNSYICHGSSSVVLQLAYLNKIFKNKSISKAKHHWLKKTIDLYSKELNNKSDNKPFTFLDSLLGTSFIFFSEILKTTTWERLMLVPKQ